MLDGFNPVVIDLNDDKHSIKDVIVHDEKDHGMVRAFILSHLTDDPNLPTPIGVLDKYLNLHTTKQWLNKLIR